MLTLGTGKQKTMFAPAKKILEKKLLALVFDVSSDLKISHRKAQFTKADCQINIRKGKQILVYDFQLELTTLGEHQIEDDSQGHYKVREILSDDLNDMLIEDVKSAEKNKTGDLMKNWIKKNGKQRIIQVFKHLEEQLMKAQPDPQKLEEDKKKREENLAATQKAREEKGVEKERLLEEQRENEKKMKQQAMKKNFSNP